MFVECMTSVEVLCLIVFQFSLNGTGGSGTDEEYCEERTGSCTPAWCCVSGCRVPSLAVLNENGYANRIDYYNVLNQTLLYPNAAASGYTSLATDGGLTSSPSCDYGWHGTPKFRCRGEQAELD